MVSKNLKLWIVIVAVMSFGGTGLRAQTAAPEGTKLGDYQVQQSYDLGYRFANVQGSQANYATFVNLQQGPRLLDASLLAHAPLGKGGMFDNFNLTTTGLGGDPQNVVRLFVSKSKWYDFTGSWRRDVNVFDYNLLSNPLNPATNTPAIGVGYTTHYLDLSHRFQDYQLRLFPLSPVTLRLGYDRNVEDGPATSTLHTGIDSVVNLGYRTTMDSYRIGVDYKPVARTVISYDQFLEYFKNDTQSTGVPTPYQLANGTPVDLGFVFNGSTPCVNPVNLSTTPPTANAACKGMLSYYQVAPLRTSLPTERISLHSAYWSNLAITGAFSYNSGKNTVNNFAQYQNGVIGRDTQTRGTDMTGNALVNRINVQGSGNVIWTISKNFNLSDSYLLNRFSDPGDFGSGLATYFTQASGGSTKANLLVPYAVFNPTNCPAPYTAATCPQHVASSAADLANSITYNYLADNTQSNTILASYDIGSAVGIHGGWRYNLERVSDGQSSFTTSATYFPGSGAALAYRGSCAKSGGVVPAGCTLNSDGSVTYTAPVTPLPPAISQIANIHGNALLFGAWVRPASQLRMNGDLEYYVADHSFDRIQPRDAQHYMFQTKYNPVSWAMLGVDVDAYNSQDNTDNTVHQMSHNRLYSATADLTPIEKLTFDFGYTYDDIYSSALICYTLSGTTPNGQFPCPVASSPVSLGNYGSYSDLDHFVYFNTLFPVMPRVTARLGFAGSFTRGSSLLLDPLAPTGALQYDYFRPNAGVDVKLATGTTFSGSWGYYDYGELGGLPSGLAPFPLDNFHANLVTLALRYAF